MCCGGSQWMESSETFFCQKCYPAGDYRSEWRLITSLFCKIVMVHVTIVPATTAPGHWSILSTRWPGGGNFLKPPSCRGHALYRSTIAYKTIAHKGNLIIHQALIRPLHFDDNLSFIIRTRPQTPPVDLRNPIVSETVPIGMHQAWLTMAECATHYIT